MAQQITKQTLIGEMLQMDMGIAAILMAAGMHCVGCPSSAMESLEKLAWYTEWTLIRY